MRNLESQGPASVDNFSDGGFLSPSKKSEVDLVMKKLEETPYSDRKSHRLFAHEK